MPSPGNAPTASAVTLELPFGKTTIIGWILPSASRLSMTVSAWHACGPLAVVAADAVQQVEHRILAAGRVAGRRVDAHLAARAERLGVVLNGRELAVGDVGAPLVEAGRGIGEGGLVVRAQFDRSAETAAARSPRLLRSGRSLGLDAASAGARQSPQAMTAAHANRNGIRLMVWCLLRCPTIRQARLVGTGPPSARPRATLSRTASRSRVVALQPTNPDVAVASGAGVALQRQR